MFTYRLKLLRLFGFDVYLDASWLIVFFLVVWSLAFGMLPATAPGLRGSTYLWMGVIAAAGLFASIVLHEMSHSLVARRFNMPIRGITLFIFGGVAEMADEPTSPRGEFLMALAGPVASLILGGLFLLASDAATMSGTKPVGAVLSYLGIVNVTLAVFNLVPALPLDGGRMLRAALWGWRKDILWASRIASIAGQLFAAALIVAGVLQFISGAALSGLWFSLIGLFLNAAAGSSYRQILARQALKGRPISRFMNRSPISAPADISLQAWVDDYVYRHHHKRFPVVDEGELLGCLGISDVADVERDQWPSRMVREVMKPCRPDDLATPETDALEALIKIQRSGGPVFVVEDGRLVGIVSLRDLMEFLALKLELEGPRAARPAANGQA